MDIDQLILELEMMRRENPEIKWITIEGFERFDINLTTDNKFVMEGIQ